VKCLAAPGCGEYSRGQLEELNRLAIEAGAKGLLTVALGTSGGTIEDLTMEMVKSVAARFLTLEQVKKMAASCRADKGDLLLIVAGDTDDIYPALDKLRREMGNRCQLIESDLYAFTFIVDFPLMIRNEVTGQMEAANNPFTMPRDEDIPLLDSAPEEVFGKNYDLVCNQLELLSGSIRIHTSALQRKILGILGYKDETVESLFGHMLEAFDFGAPPHGGFGAGIDRIMMCLTGEDSIREVVAFPKTQSATDLTLGAPSPVTEEQLAELHITVKEE
jgi:aspartyl-tRNA synthetase